MLKLKKADLEVIERQMYNKARDVDVAIFNNMTGSPMPKNFALVAISGYQNKDGGFGHAIENDNYNKDSSPYLSYVALDLMAEAGFNNTDEDPELTSMCKKTFNYLYNKCELDNGFWRATVESNNESVCAPWFKHNDETKALFGDAPTPGIIGYTLKFQPKTSPYYKKALASALKLIERFLAKSEFNMEEYLSYKVLIKVLNEQKLSDEKIDLVNTKLFNIGKEMIETDSSKFNTYCNLPLLFFDEYTNDETVDKAINDNLDYIINSLPNHGLWEASFKWQNDMPEGDTALLKWMGTITNRNLKWLKKFGRIED